MQDKQLMHEMVKELFPEEFEFLGKKTIENIVSNSEGWGGEAFVPAGGENNDYVEVVNLIEAVIQFGTAVVSMVSAKIAYDVVTKDRDSQLLSENTKEDIKKYLESNK